MEKGSKFADGTNDYVHITEDTMRLRFRTGKNNVDSVYLNFGMEAIAMEKVETEGFFDYYMAEVALAKETTPYYFEVNSGKCTFYYNKKGAQDYHDDFYDFKYIRPDCLENMERRCLGMG